MFSGELLPNAPPKTCYSTTLLQNQPHPQELELLQLVEYGLLENLKERYFNNCWQGRKQDKRSSAYRLGQSAIAFAVWSFPLEALIFLLQDP